MDPILIKQVAVPQAIALTVMSGVILYAHYKANKIDRAIAAGELHIEQNNRVMNNWFRNIR